MPEDINNRKASSLFWLMAGVLGTVAALIINLNILPKSKDPILKGAHTLDEIRDIVREKYVREVDDQELYYAALKGMVSELDPYSTFVSPEDCEDFMNSLRGDFGGLGIYVSMQAGILTVIAPIEGTPAFESGILAGDKIIKIDEEPIEGITIHEATKRLKGPVGTTVKLEILHSGITEPETVVITRAKIKIESVKGARLLDSESGVGYLRITQFQTDTAEEFRKAIVELKEQGMTKLVLDLRFNPGGIMVAAERLADEFIDNGVIVYTVERSGKKEIATALPGGLLPSEPVVVLINHGSASASEILAGALLDHKRAITIGTRSFGKGMVQSVFPVDSRRSMLKLTTAYYYTPGDHCMHTGVECNHENRFCFHKRDEEELKLGGLRPNVEVEMNQQQEMQLRRLLHEREIEHQKRNTDMVEVYDRMIMSLDVQLSRAIEYLKNTKLYDDAISKIAWTDKLQKDLPERKTLAKQKSR